LVLFFIEDVLKAPQQAAMFLIAYFAAGAIGMGLWIWLSRRIGKARAWLVGMLLSIVAFVWAFTLGAGDVTAFMIICVLSGIGLGADLALPPSMLADVIDEDQALWVKIKLAFEPPTPGRQYIGPILLYRVASLFLRVMLLRAKKRSRLVMLVRTPFSNKAAHISINVASRFSS
jgi:MFS family permease